MIKVSDSSDQEDEKNSSEFFEFRLVHHFVQGDLSKKTRREPRKPVKKTGWYNDTGIFLRRKKDN